MLEPKKVNKAGSKIKQLLLVADNRTPAVKGINGQMTLFQMNCILTMCDFQYFVGLSKGKE